MRKRLIYLMLLILLIVIMAIVFFQSFVVSKQSEDKLKLESQVTSWGSDLLVSDISPELNQKVKIAIIDSGINKQHEDLQHIKFTEFNVLDKEAAIIDEFGHGTAIAGIIAAEDNEFGVIGLNPNVEIYDVKILDENGKGEVEHLIEAIHWCIDQNVEIINLSFGFQTESKPLKEAIDRAISEGIIIVASVGNRFGMRGDYPAIYEDVIAITSVDEDLNRSSFASKHDIDYAMPGENIYTTNKDGGYSFFDGTSFATAHATGIISILLDYYKQEHNEFKKNTSFDDYLKQHSVSNNDWKFSDYGFGILKLRKED
ncbi:S8 family serine peptidase [Niallia circulans]|uniref:S8 family serine peptidase n=1 Tax=Niallia circulans TaxID=1397 RepID=UPI001560CB10|nr:S8 family serine peptidase [Niallia circulans]NRG34629.1 S8 family serine peptidase [Niallia circulans]